MALLLVVPATVTTLAPTRRGGRPPSCTAVHQTMHYGARCILLQWHMPN